jgi:UDP-N-acetylmuramate dehydrogenase
MFILENVPLSTYSTMRLGGTAAYLTDINTRGEIAEAVSWAGARGLPFIMIGGGSNIIWNDDGYPGLVMVNKIPGFEVFDMDDMNVYVTAGAGENWDSVVERTVSLGLSGLEQLSLVPGTCGATPIQNVGAYGRETSEVLVTIEAYDTTLKQLVTLRASECNFSYRSSRFKTTDKGRFLISAVTFLLQRKNPAPPFYDSLQNYLTEHGITDYTGASIREAVIAIRNSKLPDPAVVANTGSFFANPIISADQLHQLQDTYESIPFWQMEPGKVKVPAGWLIEQVGFKGIHDEETGMATWEKQALVFVNEHAEHTSDLLRFRQKVIDAVQAKFGIALIQEPELI